VVVDRKEGIIAEVMDRIFSGDRLIKESRNYQGRKAGHGGVPTFVEAYQCGVVEVGVKQPDGL